MRNADQISWIAMAPFRKLAVLPLLAVCIASTLDDVCTTEYVQNALPKSDFVPGVIVDTGSVTAEVHRNVSVTDNNMFPDGVIDFCNVTLVYSHGGLNDSVRVNYWLPDPADFSNRFLATGGGGYAINSGTGTTGSLPGGVLYGAVAGMTDGGFGSFSTQATEVVLRQNGTINRETIYMLGYQAIHEMTLLGKGLTQRFYNTSSDAKLYSYYQGCSEGGREGMSQLQRFPDQFDGAVIGAPALRYGHLQVQHLWANLVQKTLDYFPSSCEYSYIVNATIEACDPLDGRTDGIVARSDLCELHFDLDSIVGQAYSCPENFTLSTALGRIATTVAIPPQNGTVSQEAVNVVKTILKGPTDSHGRQMYVPYPRGASIDNSATAYNPETGEWELSISSKGGIYVAMFLQLLEMDNLPDLDGVTPDTLRSWMYQGWAEYNDVLQTTWPDLSALRDAGAKIIQYHGEQDGSIPPASSVHWYESVRKVMYPGLNETDSYKQLGGWYKHFPVPGAAHCGPNPYQPNAPWPQTNLQVLIDWVESGLAPDTLNATFLQGEHQGENQQICPWPLRPLWSNGTHNPECVYDRESYDTWMYDLDSFLMPVY